MKKRIFLLISLLICVLTSCEERYKEEIFIEEYQVIYGKWEYKFSVGQTGFVYVGDHTIEFIPYGKFRYNDHKSGIVKIAEQNENSLLLDFNSLFPDVSAAYIHFKGSDTMSVSNEQKILPRFYVRKH